jgi:hypothetical protein
VHVKYQKVTAGFPTARGMKASPHNRRWCVYSVRSGTLDTPLAAAEIPRQLFEALLGRQSRAARPSSSAPTPFLTGRRVQLVNLATRHAIPAIFPNRESTEIGGLMSYASNITDVWRQAGAYAGRVLKGAKPADLPVVQSSKFELVINAQTARMLGLTVPSSLLTIADEVLE